MKPTIGLGWSPQDGDLVEIAARNRFDLPAGRYRLLRMGRGSRTAAPESWRLEGITCDARQDLSGAMLVACECGGSLQPLDRATLGKDATEIRLRLHAPLMGLRSGQHRPQHDASGLDLFRAADEPELIL